ncbi:MAG: PD-(D/E)XK nuclease family protein [Paludibacteraceae bacterium]
MTTFLRQIAARYYAEYGCRMESVAFVFPNRRAGVFFRQALAAVASKPMFAPDILAINDLFLRESSLVQADKVTLLFCLYKTYSRVMPAPETFDRFVFLGEMLLADFNDIDKYMADARQVFQNIGDLKAIEHDMSWLDDEQKAIVSRFWNVLLNNRKDGKVFEQQFSNIWGKLFEIYTQFKADLRSRGIGYDGMIFRDVAENTADLHLDYTRVVFVGFNALTATEMSLFRKCQQQGIGDYYFDYQSPEITKAGNVAGQFVKENGQFRSLFELDAPQEPAERHIELIATPSDIGQTKQVYRILDELQRENSENTNLRTVVVLPNERLLVPMLYAIPDAIATVNVTMGYPLSLTPIATLMEQLIILQRNKRGHGGETLFYHKHVLAILNHPYVCQQQPVAVRNLVKRITAENLFLISPTVFEQTGELLNVLFRPVADTPDCLNYFAEVIDTLAPQVDALDREFCDGYRAAVNCINDNMQQLGQDIALPTLYRLLQQLIAGQTVAFRGEPVEGLQVMGTLETRALDFENVIITSFNEDIFPRQNHTPSIIPYSLRRVFGLPTYEYHDAIFAYNFYRLIYRARRVYLIYDSRTDGQHGEVSRYAAQLEYLLRVPLTKKMVGYNIEYPDRVRGEVLKTGEVVARLQAYCKPQSGKAVSASDINAYLDCPMRFYYSKVEELGEPDEVSETIEANTFGSIYHKVMELLYKPYENKKVTHEVLDNMLNDTSQIDNCLNNAFAEIFYKKSTKMPLFGQNLLVAHVIETYVKQTLQFDRDVRAPFVYRCSEQLVNDVSLHLQNGLSVNLKGIIDRVDEKDGIVHIADYKTGSFVDDFETIEQLFDTTEKERPKAILQLFFYTLLYRLKTNQSHVKPILYALRSASRNIAITCQKAEVQDADNYYEEFRTALDACLTEIFDVTVPFRQTEQTNRCSYCSFKQICNRS